MSEQLAANYFETVAINSTFNGPFMAEIKNWPH